MRTALTATAMALLLGLGSVAASPPAFGQAGGRGSEMGATHPMEVHPMRPELQLYPEQYYPPAPTGDYVTDYFTDTERRERIDLEVRRAIIDAQQALARGDREGAERAVERADRHLTGNDPLRLQRAIERAEGALDRGDTRAALQILRDARMTAAYQQAPTWQQPSQQQPWGATGQQQWGTGAQQPWGTTGQQQQWGTGAQQPWGATGQDRPFGTAGEPRWGGAAGQRP